jgi:hypothetical protein
MVVAKDGIQMELSNESHIAAYLSSGWVEAKASARAAEEPKVEEPVDFMPEPLDYVAPAEEKIAVSTPKARGRKKQEK